MTREDPRHYTLFHGGFFKRTGYSISRLLLTCTDSGGQTFNFFEISAMASGPGSPPFTIRSASASGPRPNALPAQGFHRVMLDATELPQCAVGFYKKCGYRRSAKIGDFFGMPLLVLQIAVILERREGCNPKPYLLSLSTIPSNCSSDA